MRIKNDITKRSTAAVASVADDQMLFPFPKIEDGAALDAMPENSQKLSKADAQAFIAALTGSADRFCTWQTFGEGTRKNEHRPEVIVGTLADVWDRLTAANERGAGVFVTVNCSDGSRKAADITSIRALFIDCDGGMRPEGWHLPPSIIVQSANGTHAYWPVIDCKLSEFAEFQVRLAKHYGSDPAVKDLPRVMRVPGFLHNKGEPTNVSLQTSSKKQYSKAEIMAGIAPLPPPPASAAKKVKSAVSARIQVATAEDLGIDIVEIFEAAGLYRRKLEVGKHAVVCPWASEHTVPDEDVGSGSTSTVIWEATAESPTAFHCGHAHCEGRKLADVLKFLGAPTKADMELERVNERYTYLEQQETIWDRDKRSFISLKSFRMRGASERQWLSAAHDGKRNTAHSPIFEPNVDKVPEHRLNLFDPSVILGPSEQSERPPQENLQHIQLFHRLLNNLAEGNAADAQYIERWTAFALRNPGRKSVALVLRGTHGTGKGLFAHMLRKIFGKYAVGIGQEQLESRFNGWMSECILGLANEVSAASFRDKAAAESKLKALVTEEMVTIERKGMDVYETPNYSKWLFMGNDRVTLIIDPQDRRYSVIASSWKLADKDPDLIDAIVKATTDRNFVQAVVDHLFALDLDSFNAHVPHKNAARDAVISDGLSGPQRWWAEEMPPPGRYPSIALHASYRQWCEKTGERCLPLSGLMRERPEIVSSVTARKDSLASPKLQALVGGINVKCVDIPDVGQGGSRTTWIAGLPVPMELQNAVRLGEAIGETVAESGHHLRLVNGGAK